MARQRDADHAQMRGQAWRQPIRWSGHAIGLRQPRAQEHARGWWSARMRPEGGGQSVMARQPSRRHRHGPWPQASISGGTGLAAMGGKPKHVSSCSKAGCWRRRPEGSGPARWIQVVNHRCRLGVHPRAPMARRSAPERHGSWSTEANGDPGDAGGRSARPDDGVGRCSGSRDRRPSVREG